MSITLPNLDDRRYADLVEEARALLVAHAPALTDHNPSDPTITLLELFAYFTEALLFRVNTVTDANRVKFLRLLNGPDWPVPTSRPEIDAQVGSTVLALRSTDRAVTAADFELLARAADPGVARAHCIPDRNLEAVDAVERAKPQPGHVSVVIVPRPNVNLDSLRKTVADYLEPRRLLTARVHVIGPRFIPTRVRVTARLLPEAPADKMKQRTVDALRSFLDPIAGGAGDGWPFGRNVYVSELYRLLDALPGIDFVRRTLDPNTTAPLDELVTTADTDRLVRNAAGELISIALEPDELVDFQVVTAKDDIDTDLVIEKPPSTF